MNKYTEAIKIIKDEIKVCENGVREGNNKAEMEYCEDMLDNKKAIPQLKEVLKMVEEENKNEGYLFNEKSMRLIGGMQKEINKLKAEIKGLKGE